MSHRMPNADRARRDLGRTIELLQGFRVEQSQPERLYRFMANDVTETIGTWLALPGRRVLDVGGGPGYVAEAFDAAGATCFTIDYSPDELSLHGRAPGAATIADGCALPHPDATFDAVHCSNVLEHVPTPERLIAELIRVCRPGGIVYLSFTNWLSPWGGHETSPFHYFGGERVRRRFHRRYGREPKNAFGVSLFRVDAGWAIKTCAADPRVEVIAQRPRYYPWWAQSVIRIPGVREVATWNVEIVMRRR